MSAKAGTKKKDLAGMGRRAVSTNNRTIDTFPRFETVMPKPRGLLDHESGEAVHDCYAFLGSHLFLVISGGKRICADTLSSSHCTWRYA